MTKREELAALIERLGAAHHRMLPSRPEVCAACFQVWPCPSQRTDDALRDYDVALELMETAEEALELHNHKFYYRMKPPGLEGCRVCRIVLIDGSGKRKPHKDRCPVADVDAALAALRKVKERKE